MANTIIQRIGLDGGDTIKSQLEAIGAAGKKAFADLTAAVQSSTAIQGFNTQLEALKAKAAAVGTSFRNAGNAADEFSSKVTHGVEKTALLVGGVAALAVGFIELVRRTAAASEEAEKAATSLGLTVEQFKALVFVFGQAGVESEAFTRGMQKFDQSIDAANAAGRGFDKEMQSMNRDLALGRITVEQYTKTQEDMRFKLSQNENAFTRLGVEIAKTDNGEIDNHETLLRVSDALQEMGDKVQAATLAQQLFGRKNGTFINALLGGRDAILAMEKEAERVAPPLTELEQKVGVNLTRAFNKLETAATNLQQHALAPFFAPLTALVNAVTEAIIRNRDHIVELANTIANQARPIIGDLIALLEGRDEAVQNGFILKSRDAMVAFASAVKTAAIVIVASFQEILVILDNVARGFNSVFGTNLTGGVIAATALLARFTGLFGIIRAAVVALVAVVQILIVSFGAVGASLAILGVLIGFFAFDAIQKMGGISGAWNALWGAMGAFASNILNRIQALLNAVVDGFVAGVKTVVDGFVGLPDAIAAAFAAVVAIIQAVWDGLVAGAKALVTSIVEAFKTGVDAITGFFTGLRDSVVAVFQAIIDGAKAVVTAISDAVGGGNSGTSDNTASFARGGHVRGAGSGTSDSILARISNGEFIIRAKAVAHFGPAFFDALNNLRVPSPLPKFNMGGLVDSLGALMPAPLTGFAGGGLVGAINGGSGGRPFTLQIGPESFGGMTAQQSTIDRLQRYATAKQVNRTGRKPSWFQG